MPRDNIKACKNIIYLFKYFFPISLKVGPTYERKMMKGYLAQKYKVNISQKKGGRCIESCCPKLPRKTTNGYRRSNKHHSV